VVEIGGYSDGYGFGLGGLTRFELTAVISVAPTVVEGANADGEDARVLLLMVPEGAV
jgi:hypothetical protein